MEDFVQEATNWHFLSQLGPETLRLAGFSGHHYLQIFLQIFSDTFQETITYKYCLILFDIVRYFSWHHYFFYRNCLILFRRALLTVILFIFFRRPLVTDISTCTYWYFSGHHYLQIFLNIFPDTFQQYTYRYFFIFLRRS